MNNSTFELPTWTVAPTTSSQDYGTCIETLRSVPFLILVSLTALSSILAVVGNASILWAVHKNKSLRNVSNNLIVSLCLSDLITGLLVSPLSIAMATLLRHEEEHERLESFLFFFLGVVLINTTLTLSTVSVDRYIAIVFPLRYKELVTQRKSVCILIGTWTFAVVTPSPRLVFLQEHLEQIIFGSIVIALSIPLVITVYCYFKILKVAQKQAVCPVTSGLNVAYYTLKNKKTTITMAMILGLFTVVYTPLFGFAALALSGHQVCHVHEAGDWLWPTFVVCASAALNPLVYGIRNMMIRNALKKIFIDIFKREQVDKNRARNLVMHR
ncbi:histamine H2 receptor-like [Actinia tenebrosa]|uniref:Histamine H2 receptor-like n=1 Tax=Actinia tenebrosa TaxID=6105 RepID=A0A6P8J3H3_ACTTE|nr:histamine H2 receptor-like [Actinia tenebrosa]XP_031574561.1 histamine H2 receptor-like [Actinia tenebrosa]